MKTTEDEENLEQASDTLSEEQLNRYKWAIEEAQSDAGTYLSRNKQALAWWCAQWPGQYNNGRKWAESTADRELLLPWPNASDTRDRTVEMVVDEHVLVLQFALQNMKVQGTATQKFKNMRPSSQVTTLLNWQLFTHMKTEMHREMNFAGNWRFGYGLSIIETVWEQLSRLYREEITVMSLLEFVNAPMGAEMAQEAVGERAARVFTEFQGVRVDEMAAAVMDPEYDEDIIAVIQSMSQIVSKPEARQAVKDLRELRYAEIKVADVFKSKPRVTALRACVDILFDQELDDLQHARWIDRIERVSEAELMDRVETAGYDPVFVDEALAHKGEATNEDWSRRTTLERAGYYNTIGPNTRGKQHYAGLSARDDADAMVELHHVSRMQHDRGVPVLFNTVLHMAVDRVAVHAPTEYDHGQFCYHAFRHEYKHRPILSSEGIPEKAYTWEQELKAQADLQTDRSELALQPPMLTDSYEEVQKMKAAFSPASIIPIRRHGSFQWFQPPQYDIGSVQIVKAVMDKVDRFFGLFGPNVDPDKKQMRRIQLGATVMTELHPVIMQIFQLDQQYLPDAEVAAVVGTLSRPFNVDRHEIQGAHEISATVDMRPLDKDFLETAMKFIVQLAGLDTMGIIDRAYLVRSGAEMISADFAENAIQQTEPATEAERQDEIKAVNAILSSGIDQVVPASGNFQLRLQTLQQHAQELLSTNKVVQRFVQQNPEVMEVLQNRAKGFAGQLQQGENAKIGRMQTTETFTKNAPTAEAALGMGGGY